MIINKMSYRIQKIDKDFDGIVFENNKAIKVPYTLVNELVDIKKIDTTNNIAVATDFEIIETSEHRKEASCKYFAKCGGCKAQHFKEEDYLAQKVSNLKHLLEVNGIDYTKTIEVEHHFGRGERRRAILSVEGKKVGFKAYRSNKVVDIAECEILTSKINDTIKYLREILAKYNAKFKISELTITDINANIDILIKAKSKIDIDIINAFQNIFTLNFIKKITWNNETLIVKEDIQLSYGNYKIPFSSGGFLQAEKFGEDAFIKFVLDNLKDSKRVLDLFCGYGSYAFSILNATEVERVEGFDIAKSSINAINKYQSSRIKAEVKDLFKNPVDVNYINKFDSVIINPPRVGAMHQIEEIAKSNIEKIVMIYCSAESAVRDILLLQKTKIFKPVIIKVVDQFIYSSHIEVLICFEKI